ncbi:MAG: adenylate kinase [Chloroflexota bacterium]|jgi:adenylate kinase
MLFVVLMGGPGAGKGTQARILERSLEIPQVASGDLFREHLKNKTELGQLAKQYIDAGKLVPDDVTVEMVRERLSRTDCSDGAILDGFPRTIPQAKALNKIFMEKDDPIVIVPYIHVDPDVLLRRLAGRWTCTQCGHVFHTEFNPPKVEGICDFDGSPLYQREDDTEETQKRRIEVFFEQTTPILDYYRDKDLLVEIDGNQSINEVQRDLIVAIRNAENAYPKTTRS